MTAKMQYSIHNQNQHIPSLVASSFSSLSSSSSSSSSSSMSTSTSTSFSISSPTSVLQEETTIEIISNGFQWLKIAAESTLSWTDDDDDDADADADDVDDSDNTNNVNDCNDNDNDIPEDTPSSPLMISMTSTTTMDTATTKTIATTSSASPSIDNNSNDSVGGRFNTKNNNINHNRQSRNLRSVLTSPSFSTSIISSSSSSSCTTATTNSSSSSSSRSRSRNGNGNGNTIRNNDINNNNNNKHSNSNKNKNNSDYELKNSLDKLVGSISALIHFCHHSGVPKSSTDQLEKNLHIEKRYFAVMTRIQSYYIGCITSCSHVEEQNKVHLVVSAWELLCRYKSIEYQRAYKYVYLLRDSQDNNNNNNKNNNKKHHHHRNNHNEIQRAINNQMKLAEQCTACKKKLYVVHKWQRRVLEKLTRTKKRVPKNRIIIVQSESAERDNKDKDIPMTIITTIPASASTPTFK